MKSGKISFKLRHALFPAGYYGSNAIYQGYISLFYTQLGFTRMQLGMISAATAVSALMVQPLWGRLGDRSGSRRNLLALLCLLSAASLPLALLNGAFAFQMAAAMLFYAFFCALLPLGDAILLETDGAAFGAYRLCGGASFALMGALFGAARAGLGAGGVVWASGAALLLTALAARQLPTAPGRQQRKKACMRPLLQNRELVALLLFALPLQMTMGFFYTFYAPHFQSLRGGTDALLGLSYLISAACEAPYLLLSRRIYRRFGAQIPMAVAAALLGARWWLLSGAQHAGVALASQILHGGGFIVITVSMAYWIAEHVPEDLRTSGQGLLNMVTFGGARIAGNLLGGWWGQRLGLRSAFSAGALVCLAALVAFLPFLLRRRARA